MSETERDMETRYIMIIKSRWSTVYNHFWSSLQVSVADFEIVDTIFFYFFSNGLNCLLVLWMNSVSRCFQFLI